MDVTFTENGKTRVGVLVQCKICNKEFPTRKSKPHKCCSPECGNLYRRKRVEVTCRNCGKVFEKKKCQLDNSKSGLYFCTRKCKDEAQKLGGVEEIMPSHYGTSEGRGVYKTLIENEECPRCAGCGENKTYLLCVHHIDGNHDNNVKENFEIVCWNCHIKRHLRFDELKNKWLYSGTSLTPRHLLNEV
jgi:hypothetical protein